MIMKWVGIVGIGNQVGIKDSYMIYVARSNIFNEWLIERLCEEDSEKIDYYLCNWFDLQETGFIVRWMWISRWHPFLWWVGFARTCEAGVEKVL